MPVTWELPAMIAKSPLVSTQWSIYFQKNSVRQIHKAIIQSPLARAVDIGKIVHHHKD